ncbi:MAG: hypothetical protein LUG12_10675 [Erysipelotrichaceae bacterium]|nr:hypothetical protein [Erysipelotrichaceae bacterium]
MRGPNRKISYWRINEEWYYTKINSKGHVKYYATDKAPKEAKKSLNAYYRYIRMRKLMGTW